jgi:pimeloyl-ACP methyl ester carboxylesterase
MGATRREFVFSASSLAMLGTTAPVHAQSSPLEVIVWGSGPRVVLVHGSVSNGPMTWSEQKPLGERWRLEVVNRRGYGKSPPPAVRQDFEEDAVDIVALLGDGAHLVGHSYGAISALIASAARPQAVRSLTINEPPVFSIVKGNAAADEISARTTQLRQRDIKDPRAFLEAFRENIGGPGQPPLPDPLPAALEQGVRTTMTGRDPSEAKIPLDALKRTTFPKLVTSGGHHPAFEAVCDLIATELKAERAIIRGQGHGVPRTGAPFNERLEAFLKGVRGA